MWEYVGGWGRQIFFFNKLYQKKDYKMFCSLLSSVPIRCLAKAYFASGLHMLLSWYSGSFQHYCLQDTEIVSSHHACVACRVSAPVLQCPGSFPSGSWEMLLPSNDSPQSTLLKSELCGSSALTSSAKLLLFCCVCEDTSLLQSTLVVLKACALEAAS